MPRYDLLVLGSGAGGQKAALQAAKLGKRVAVVESYSSLGGGCTHFGTLPSKSFRESVYRFSLGSSGMLHREMECVDNPGSFETVMPDMKRLLRRKERVVKSESQVIVSQFERNKIKVFHGFGKFKSGHEVEVTQDNSTVTVEAEYICIATGAHPVCPKSLESDGKTVFDSDSILGLEKIPKSLCVLGAGIIGCEYASMFSMAGTHVIMVDKRKEILSSVDQEIVEVLLKRFMSLGMGFYLGYELESVETLSNGQRRIKLQGGKVIDADAILIAQGRKGNTDGLGLENIGLTADERGLISVNPKFRTKVPNIFAVGDVIGFPALASTSMEQGRVAALEMFGGSGSKNGLTDIYPYGIYTIPEISMVGETEQQLKAKGSDYVTGVGYYREVARGQIVGDSWGMVKLLVDRKSKKILGVHIIGDSAADLVHIGQAVMTFGGDIYYFIERVFNFPTFAEAYKTAAYSALNELS